MTVYQVEEYYIVIDAKQGQVPDKAKAEEVLQEEGLSNYEWDDDNRLIIDELQDEHEAEDLESKLKEFF